jgi:predicted CxxxxCH...CXXCH cytochrome family protein
MSTVEREKVTRRCSSVVGRKDECRQVACHSEERHASGSTTMPWWRGELDEWRVWFGPVSGVNWLNDSQLSERSGMLDHSG